MMIEPIPGIKLRRMQEGVDGANWKSPKEKRVMDKSNDGQLIYCSNCKTPTTFTEYLTGDYYDKEVCDNCGNVAKSMETYHNCYYVEKCSCGNEMFVLTQPDCDPEYHVTVGIKCNVCGEIVSFSIPVN